MYTNQIQLRHLFDIFSGSTPETGKGFYWDGDIAWITPEDISVLKEKNLLSYTKRKITDEGFSNTGLKLAPEDAIVFTKRAPIGNLAILNIKACCNQGCFLLVPKIKANSLFFYYYLLSQKKYLQILGRGSTFMELSLDEIKSLKVPYLSIHQQLKIANYLNSKAKKIDEQIELKEKQVTLLNEKRQALIIQAVTRGLDPNVKLKDSGVEWLGDIPRHWTKLALKYVCKNIQTGGTPSPDWINYKSDKMIDWFTPGDFNNNDFTVQNSNRKLSIEAIENEGYTLYPKGSILIIGIGATLGKVGYILNDAYCNQQINILTLTNSSNYEYMTYLISTLESVLKINANSATLPILNQQKLGEITIVQPPLEEQVAIASFIKGKLKQLNEIVEMTQKSIILLKERRMVLISAAVTGQIEI